MQRWQSLRDIPADLGRTTVTIGNFDGVHKGHQRVLGDVVQRARSGGATSVAITFDPHPAAVLFPDRAPEAIDGLGARLDLMSRCGLDAVLVMTFTRELAAWSPRRFVEDVLVKLLHAATVVVGRDTRFGHRNAGDVNTLRELGAEFDFEVVVVDDVGCPTDQRWSSTAVRSLLAKGDVATASVALGRHHQVRGTIVHGDHRGRELGFPTANLGPDLEGLIPADGVYAGWLTVLDETSSDRLPAAISIGTNPTFDGEERRVEVYVLDRDDLELYGRRVAVDFVAQMRETVRFDSVDALIEQMHRDVAGIRDVLDSATDQA